ncbi:MAG: OadG family protein [Bacteroidales bacterium]|nr:OadG family protein [Bacteroidales bacterium]MDD3701047.1 OadG family protein [Bacteroidales bacterium]MDY0369315.1 OadG family protein [Bacteroidales bacterium]
MILLSLYSDVSTTILVEGIVISIVGYTVVFAALVILFYFFHYLSKIINRQTKIKLIKLGKMGTAESSDDLSVPGEVTAAIGMALYFATQLHDEESNVITIKKVSRVYSPWSSKIYGLRNLNR